MKLCATSSYSFEHLLCRKKQQKEVMKLRDLELDMLGEDLQNINKVQIVDPWTCDIILSFLEAHTSPSRCIDFSSYIKSLYSIILVLITVFLQNKQDNSMPYPPHQTNFQPSHSHSRNSSINTIRTAASPFDPLSAALATAQAHYTLTNQSSLEAHNNACDSLPGGNTRTVLHASPFPMTFGLFTD